VESLVHSPINVDSVMYLEFAHSTRGPRDHLFEIELITADEQRIMYAGTYK
jgi:hypothetical protein